MDLGIKGRKAIVCASSKGLGKGCAAALAGAGVDVVINGRDETVLKKTADEIAKAHGVTVTPVAADVGTREGQDALIAACGEPDILVNNNAGPPLRDFRTLDRQAMLDGMVLNMVTPIELIQRVIDGMAARGFGRIVNITSASVRTPIVGLDLSSGARAGLTGFLAGIARTVAGNNVTINHMLPGSFDTDRLRANLQAAAQREKKPLDEVTRLRAAGNPTGRFGTPEEFGAMCAFLCSAHAGYITGQNILLDGGEFRSAF